MGIDTGSTETPAEVYLLHFNKPYWLRCIHYVGYTSKGVQSRLQTHCEGRGSKLVRYALNHGCDFVLARTFGIMTRKEAKVKEIQLKRTHKFSQYCPICKEAQKNGHS